MNAFVRRKDHFITNHLDRMVASFIKEEVEAVIISGDFTTTSDKAEFEMAKSFLDDLETAGITAFIVPGNHDVYTSKACKEKFFYHYLSPKKALSLNGWDMLLLDCTIDNPPFLANGSFTKEHEEEVITFLKNTKKCMIINHFPLDESQQKHKLLGGETLKKILFSHKGTILYMHGHTHKTKYSNPCEPVHIFNSSEATVKEQFKYHLIELKEETFSYKEVKYFQ